MSNYSLIQLFRNPNETAINLTCLPIRNIWYDEKYHKKDNVEDPDAENSPEQDTGQIYPRLDGDEGFFFFSLAHTGSNGRLGSRRSW